MNILLLPLSSLYFLITSIRNYLYDWGLLSSYSVSLPVVCVGNVVVGGSGKSPVVRHLVNCALSAGRHPVILLRGYRGRLKGPKVVEDCHGVSDVGDEAKMHFDFFANKVPVVVSADRYLGAKMIADTKLGDLIIMDDGYQHRRLRRDVNLLIIPRSGLKRKNKFLLPGGPCRESYAQAFKRADILVAYDKETVADIGEGKSVTQINRRIASFKDLYTGECLPLSFFKNKRVVTVCALGSPEQFFNSLKDRGVEISKKYTFSDHYLYKGADYDIFTSSAHPVVCTGKDAVKLKPFVNRAGECFVAEEYISLNPELTIFAAPSLQKFRKN